MRQAEWALRPSTERDIAEEQRRLGVCRRFGWAMGLAYLGLCPLTLAGILKVLVEQASVAYVLVPLAALGGLGIEYGRRYRRADNYARGRFSALKSEYADLNGWFAEICVLQGAAPTGYDRGALWFEEDRLTFVGERTSFALSTGDIQGGLREHWGIAGLLPTTALSLRSRTVAGDAALGIEIVAEFTPGRPYRGIEDFRKALRAWLVSGQGSEGQLPPLVLGPGAPRSAELFRAALTVTIVWIVLATIAGILLLAFGTAALAAITFFVCVLFACTNLWTLRLRWRAWHHRKRLDRGRS